MGRGAVVFSAPRNIRGKGTSTIEYNWNTIDQAYFGPPTRNGGEGRETDLERAAFH